MKYMLPIILIIGILAVGCAPTDPLAGYCEEGQTPVVVCENKTDEQELTPDLPEQNETKDEKDKESGNETEDKEPKEDESEDVEYSVTRTYEEGDLVSFADVTATDPDGDVIDLSYSDPLNESGEWQTGAGDAGEYTVRITASDQDTQVERYALVKVEATNRPPQLSLPEEVNVDEGETVTIEPDVSDPEGDDVEVSFSGWMDSSSYKTTYDDAGSYQVTVIASDGKNQVEETVTVNVNDVNRAPVIEKPSYDIVAMEGDEIELDLNMNDPDGDELEVTYSDPFDSSGTWQTEEGDAGEYNVEVTASDGDKETSVEVPVTVESSNNPPVIEGLEDIEVDEGETVTIEPEVSDPDGDDVEVSFSGWMDSSTYETDYDDEGVHTVNVTASDGEDSVTEQVEVTVNNVNREPEIIWE